MTNENVFKTVTKKSTCLLKKIFTTMTKSKQQSLPDWPTDGNACILSSVPELKRETNISIFSNLKLNYAFSVGVCCIALKSMTCYENE